jgi:hypothetical protein
MDVDASAVVFGVRVRVAVEDVGSALEMVTRVTGYDVHP